MGIASGRIPGRRDQPETEGLGELLPAGHGQQAYRLVDNHVRYRLRRWLKAKYKVRGPGKTRFPKGYLYEDLGLLQPAGLGRHALRVRKRDRALSESRMRENRPSGSMSGEWKRSMARLVRHRQTKGPATDRPSLNHRATPRLYSPAILPSRLSPANHRHRSIECLPALRSQCGRNDTADTRFPG